jgi:hypothetical protein
VGDGGQDWGFLSPTWPSLLGLEACGVEAVPRPSDHFLFRNSTETVQNVGVRPLSETGGKPNAPPMDFPARMRQFSAGRACAGPAVEADNF